MALLKGALLAGSTIFGMIGEEAVEEEKDRRAEEAARARLRRVKEIERLGQEKLYDIEVAGREFEGTARAATAAGGLRGTGSAATRIKRVRGKYRRQAELLRQEIDFRTTELRLEAREIRKRRSAEKSIDFWNFGSDLFSSGDGFL